MTQAPIKRRYTPASALGDTPQPQARTQGSRAKSFGDFQSTTIKGRVAFMEVKSINERETLVLKLATRLGEHCEARLEILNSNGLLTAYNNGNLVVGQDLTVSGAIRNVRSHYINKDQELVALKFPELKFTATDFDFGAKPMAREEEVMVESEEEEEEQF